MSGGSGPLPWLRYGGAEVGNAARTLSYLRAGLGTTMQGHWELGPGDVCSVLYRDAPSNLLYGQPLPPLPPGQNYTIPGGATVCSTQAQINAAVGSGTPANIVIEDGTYTRVGFLTMGAAHKIYARHAGLAILQYGFQSGSVVGAELHGLYFDVADPANTLAPGIVHMWGSSASWKIQDCWFDGHLVNDNGVLSYNPVGVTVERVWAHNFLDNGLRLNDNVGFAATPIIQRVWDIDVANVYRASRGASNGTGESGIMLGHKVTDGVKRVKIRNTGWQGVATNSNCRDTAFTDLDIDQIWGVVPGFPVGETGVGVYIERSCHNLTFTRFDIGPDLYIGFNGEWDTGSAGTAGMNNVTVSTGTISTTRVSPYAPSNPTPRRGIYGDAGGDRLFVDHVRFIGMDWACIAAYLMTNTPLSNFTNNDYSLRAAGAKRVVTQHANTSVGSLVELVFSDGNPLTPTVTFASPASDPAPWYDPEEPGAATFLGLVLLDIQGYDSTLYRAVSNRIGGLGGATFSKQHRKPRTWKFRGALISSDDAGAEYGLRWLTDVLQAADCDDCALGGLSVRLSCPPDDASNDAFGLWTSYDVALTDGPNLVEPYAPRSQAADRDVLAGCRDYVIVEFTMTAGNPFLYRAPVECFEFTLAQNLVCNDICAFLFGSPGDAHCCVIEPPERGTMGAVFTFHSAAGIGALLLEAYAGCPGGSGGSGPSVLRTQMQLSGIPAGATVVVDSAQHKITVTDAAGNASDGSSLVVLPAGQAISWLEVRDCDDVTCLCVRTSVPCASGSVDVTIATQEREG